MLASKVRGCVPQPHFYVFLDSRIINGYIIGIITGQKNITSILSVSGCRNPFINKIQYLIQCTARSVNHHDPVLIQRTSGKSIQMAHHCTGCTGWIFQISDRLTVNAIPDKVSSFICHKSHFIIGKVHSFCKLSGCSQKMAASVSVKNHFTFFSRSRFSCQLQSTCIFIRKCLWPFGFYRRSLLV